MAVLLVPRNCVQLPPLLCVLLILQYIPVSECIWNHLHLATKGKYIGSNPRLTLILMNAVVSCNEKWFVLHYLNVYI